MITEYSMTFFRPLELVESILLVLLYKTENIVVVCGVSLLFVLVVFCLFCFANKDYFTYFLEVSALFT
jgi:hypothetical protein